MAPMFTEDFILRQINLAMVVLLRVLKLKQAGQQSEALQAIDQGLETLLGLRAGLAKQLDDQRLLAICTTQEELNVGRVAVLADLFREEGEILALENRSEESTRSYLRALRFYLEVALSDLAHIAREQIAQIESLVQQLSLVELPIETRLALLDYCEGLLKLDERLLAAVGVSRIDLLSRSAHLESTLRGFLDPPG